MCSLMSSLSLRAGAVGYYEASALSGAGVEETVEFCVRTVLSVRNAPPPKSTLSRKRFVDNFVTHKSIAVTSTLISCRVQTKN